jgi:hypothetical protein
VRSKDVFCFVAQEDYTQWPDWDGEEPDDDDLRKRLIPFIRLRPVGQQWSAAQLTGFNGILIGFSPVPPKPQVLAAGVSGGVYATGSGESQMEEIPLLSEGGPRRGAVLKLKTIGEHLYMCGNGRSVGYRTGKSEWVSHTRNIPDAPGSDMEGFNDIDGFSESDIYAVGGAGDVWHFDGTAWSRCAFPSDLPLTTVCCAGDGNVYVGAALGNIFRGRHNRWEPVHQDIMSIPFRDMVWYEDQLWCTSDYGLWTFKDGRFGEAPVSADVKICSGNLSARDGVLLVAGHGGAAFRQDGGWKVIFHQGAMSEAVTK